MWIQALVSAFVITALVVGFVATLAVSTDIDFTKFGGILAIVGWAFLVGIIIATFWVSSLSFLMQTVVHHICMVHGAISPMWLAEADFLFSSFPP